MAVLVEIRWPINPFRGDKFAEGWLPVAEAAVDYGATSWAFYRALDGRLDFIQHAIFPSKADFERYWYSDEISALREAALNYFNKPLLPSWHTVVVDSAAVETVD